MAKRSQKDGRELDVDWDKIPLGLKTDKVLAGEVGCSVSAIFNQRRKRGIPPYGGRRRKRSHLNIDWDTVPLGQEHDTAIAERLGCSTSTVYQHRIRRGIRSKGGGRSVTDWSLVQFEGRTDQEIAEEYGCCLATAAGHRKKRGIYFKRGSKPRPPPEGLGTVSDGDLARKLGLSRQRIHQIRKREGVPSARSTRVNEAIRNYDWTHIPLGKFSDVVIADVYGMSRSAVTLKRRQEGIPACTFSLREQLVALLRALVEGD